MRRPKKVRGRELLAQEGPFRGPTAVEVEPPAPSEQAHEEPKFPHGRAHAKPVGPRERIWGEAELPDVPEVQGGKELLHRQIHDALSDETALCKLQVEHYLMSPDSFRHRTSELHLSPMVCDLYEQVVKECEHCQKSHVRPVKSLISGLRASSFGDLIFVDHTDVIVNGGICVVFVTIDGATHFCWAYHQKTKPNTHASDVEKRISVRRG